MTKQAPRKKNFARSGKVARRVVEISPAAILRMHVAETVRMRTADLGKQYASSVVETSHQLPEFVNVTVVRGTGAVIAHNSTAKDALLAAVRKDQSAPSLGAPSKANGKDVIVARLSQRMTSRGRAEHWYRHHKIPAFGHRTPSQLVRMGMTEAVVKYLDGLDSGAYA